MRILQALGWYYPENLGGTEIYVSSLARDLIRAGHEVTVAAPLAGIESVRQYSIEGVDVLRYPVPLAPTRAEAQGRQSARGVEYFNRFVQDYRPDVAHFHSIVTGLGLREFRIAADLGAKVIVTSHASSLGYICQRGTLMHWGRTACDGPAITKCAACELQHRGLPQALARTLATIPPTMGSRLRETPGRVSTALGMSALIEMNLASQAELIALVDRFVVLTGWAARIVEANVPQSNKLVINRLGISDSGLSRKPGPDTQPTSWPVRFGYLGRFDAVKGILELAEAIRRLPSSRRFEFELRGPASGEAEKAILQDVRTRLAHDPRVAFAPAADRASVGSVLSAYDVLCCPSVCAEGGPTVALEAQAVGTPVIGSRIGGLAEIVNDGVNGRLVPPGDVGALSRMIDEIAAVPAIVDRWRREVSPVRTMADVALDYLRLYEEVLAA